MKKMKVPNLRTVSIHFSVWILHISINNILLFYNFSSPVFIKRTLLTYPLVVVLFYVNAHLIANRFIPQRQYIQVIVSDLLLVSLYVAFRFILFSYLFPYLGFNSLYYDYKLMLDRFLLDSLWIASQYLLFSYGYWFAYHQINLQRVKKELVIKLNELEKDRMMAEIAFLQAQINPHFLYNTFNFIYSEAFFISPRLADAILLLSTVMRSLTEMGKKPLQPMDKVLDLITNYLKLQKYRYSELFPIEIVIEGEDYLPHTKVPPLLFITLVENIFKHGDLTHATTPAQILIHVTDTTLLYRSINKKSVHSTFLSTGVGMENLRKQLSLFYGDAFHLHIAEENMNYTLELALFNTCLAENYP